MGKVTDRLKKRLVERIVLHKEFRSYSHALRRIAPAAPQTQKSLVIIPCAPDSVIGSRGDEAMIVASIQNFRRSAGTEAPVTIICSDSFSNPGWSWLQQRYNVSLSKIWNGPYPVGKVVDEVVKLQPSEIYILGADCMDGHYSPYISFELLALYTILRKKQYRISLLGFSYNNHPHRLLNRLFRKIGKDVPFNLRDSISLEHFRQHTRLPNTRLVADAAFMLVPDSKSEAASRYKTKIDALRKNGATVVLAFNLHPMLRKEQTQQELAEYARAMSSRFQELLLKLWEGDGSQEKKTVVFVTHDIDEAILLSDRIIMMSANPGQIFREIPVPFSRPRDRASLVQTKDYSAFRNELLSLFYRDIAEKIGGNEVVL